MNTMSVTILDPKAVKLLESLAELKLISIQEEPTHTLESVLNKLRSKSKSAPRLAEITKEVEIVRTKRYANKAK